MYLICIDEIKRRQEKMFSKISEDNSIAVLLLPPVKYRFIASAAP